MSGSKTFVFETMALGTRSKNLAGRKPDEARDGVPILQNSRSRWREREAGVERTTEVPRSWPTVATKCGSHKSGVDSRRFPLNSQKVT
jgi:hypothetical protein